MTPARAWNAPPERLRAGLDRGGPRREAPTPRRAADIIATVARAYGYTAAQVKGERRHSTLLKARKACALALREVGYSYPEIGALLGRDHSSVMQLINHERLGARVLVESDPRFKAAVAAGLAVK